MPLNLPTGLKEAKTKWEGSTGPHAVLCHVRLGMTELLYSRNVSRQMDIADHRERRLTLAQGRFTRAMSALSRLRLLLARVDSAREASAQARSARNLATLKQLAG